MKTMRYITTGAAGLCTLLAAFVTPASAAEMDAGWYFKVEAGPNWTEESNVDIGFRAGAGVGYHINRFVGVEFETGWIWNELEDSDISLSHVPLLFNAVFRWENESKFVPYVGVGMGAAYSILNVDEDDFDRDDTDGDAVFAWQFMAGVRYRIDARTSIGVYYKYLATSDSDFEIDNVRYRADDVHNHSVGVSFQMTF